MSEDKVFLAEFVKREQVAKDTYTFYFKRGEDSVDFIPGQTFEMKLNIKNSDERGDTRIFTISSPPTNKEFYTFTTRIIQSSFKHAFYNLIPGEKVELKGPWDDLSFDDKDARSKVFLAGGIGVTPFHSIVGYAIDKTLDMDMTLFVSWSTKDEMVFDEFFRSATQIIPRFKYVPTLTHEKDLKDWNGEVGRINGELVKKYVKDVKSSLYYFAGPPTMVKAMKEIVIDLGVDQKQLLAEEFEGY